MHKAVHCSQRGDMENCKENKRCSNVLKLLAMFENLRQEIGKNCSNPVKTCSNAVKSGNKTSSNKPAKTGNGVKTWTNLKSGTNAKSRKNGKVEVDRRIIANANNHCDDSGKLTTGFVQTEKSVSPKREDQAKNVGMSRSPSLSMKMVKLKEIFESSMDERTKTGDQKRKSRPLSIDLVSVFSPLHCAKKSRKKAAAEKSATTHIKPLLDESKYIEQLFDELFHQLCGNGHLKVIDFSIIDNVILTGHEDREFEDLWRSQKF